MAASAASISLCQVARESGSTVTGTHAASRRGAAATRRWKRATRPGYTGPKEFTWRNRPRSFSMSTISGSMNRSCGKEAISSSAGAGFSASKRLNEKNTGGCSSAWPARECTPEKASSRNTPMRLIAGSRAFGFAASKYGCDPAPVPYSYSTSRILAKAMQRPSPMYRQARSLS